MNIFISHSSKDAVIAAKLCEQLEIIGYSCFLAPRDIRPGYEYAEEIMKGIDSCELMLVLMSEDANVSPHVSREIERAVSKNLHIITCKLENLELSKSMEYYLMARQWVDTTTNPDNVKPIVVAVKEYSQIKNVKEDRLEKVTSKKGGLARARKRRKIGLILGMVASVLIVLGLSSLFLFGMGPDYAEVQAAQSLTFGTYNNNPIEWRVLQVDEDGKTALLVSKDILTMKSFDAPEGGTYARYQEEDYWADADIIANDYDKQIKVFGNSDWSKSNIRTWLNADTEVVKYSDYPPCASAMSEEKNAYNYESGFLYHFTQEERAAIIESEVKTKGNALQKGEEIITKDKVFLLSKEELSLFDEAGMNMFSVPTQAAIDQDETNWYEMNVEAKGRNEFYYWLRDADDSCADKCYVIGAGDTGISEHALFVALEGYGIRPVIRVDLSSPCFIETE